MKRMSKVWMTLVLLALVSLLLAACGAGGTGNTPAPQANATPTVDPVSQFPTDLLPLSPQAMDVKVITTSDTYSYQMPGLVQDALNYLQPELENLGWTEAGNPTIMGHLATLVMEKEGYRLNVSLQDNERSQTTRVQMIMHRQ